MGGHETSVLIKECLSDKDANQILNWIQSISSDFEKEGDYWNYCIVEGASVGSSYKGNGKPLGIHFEMTEFEPYEEAQIRKYLGYVPKQEIGLFAMCSGETDYELLMRVTIEIAKQYDGLIDMGNYICPPIKKKKHRVRIEDPKTKERKTINCFTTIETTQDDIRRFVGDIPGKAYEIEWIEDEREWVTHIVDIEFLESWVKLPHF